MHLYFIVYDNLYFWIYEYFYFLFEKKNTHIYLSYLISHSFQSIITIATPLIEILLLLIFQFILNEHVNFENKNNFR